MQGLNKDQTPKFVMMRNFDESSCTINVSFCRLRSLLPAFEDAEMRTLAESLCR